MQWVLSWPIAAVILKCYSVPLRRHLMPGFATNLGQMHATHTSLWYSRIKRSRSIQSKPVPSRALAQFTMFTRLNISVLLLLVVLSYALPSTDLQFSSFRVGLMTQTETEATSLSTDNYGNTYIVGNTYGSFGDADVNHLSDMSIFIAKFSVTGILVWLRRTGSAHSDRVLEIFYLGAVLYVTGLTKGNVSTDSSPQDTSSGIQDGFVLAYNSFTGKRKWSTQLGRSGGFTQVDVVTASHQGVFIAGHSNLTLRESRSNTHELAATGWRFFVARLNHATGDTRRFAQYDLNLIPRPMLVPVQIMLTDDSKKIFLIVQVVEDSIVKDSVVVSLQSSNLSKSRIQSLSAQHLQKVSEGLTQDVKSGDIVISYSLNVINSPTRDFGVQIVHRNGSSMSMGKTKMVDLYSGSDDICQGVELIRMRYAVMLGSVTKVDNSKPTKQLGIWIYDLRNGETVGTYLSSSANEMSSMQVAGFGKDDEEDIVFAGVRRKTSGMREVMLGTFGIPPHLKSNGADNAGVYLTTNKPGDVSSSVNNSNAVNATAVGGPFTLDENGRLRTDGIIAICLCVVLGILLVAVVSLCIVKIWRERGNQ